MKYKLNPYCLETGAIDGRRAVYNPVNKASVVYRTEQAPRFLDMVEALEPRQIEGLLRSGILRPDDFDDFAEFEAQRDVNRYNGLIGSIVVYLGLGCNLGCGYCYENGLDRSEALTPAQIRSTQELIAHLVTSGMQTLDLCFIGGEPLLYLDEIEQICSAIPPDLAHDVQLVTNGTLLRGETIARLAALGIWNYQITLDGGQAAHDAARPYIEGERSSYQDIMKSIAEAEAFDERFSITVNCNLTASNSDQVEPVLKNLAAQGFRGDFVFSYVFEVGGSTLEGLLTKKDTVWRDAVLLAEKYGHHSSAFRRAGYLACPMRAENYYIIGSDGRFSTCLNGVGRPGYASVPLSSTGTPAFDYARAAQIESHPVTKACRSCEFLVYCDGNCAYFNQEDGFDCPQISFRRNEKEILTQHLLSGDERVLLER